MSNFNNQRNLDSAFAGGGFNLLTRNPSGDLSPSGRKNLLYQPQQQQQQQLLSSNTMGKQQRNYADDDDTELNNIGFSNNNNNNNNTNGLLEKLQQPSPQSQFAAFSQQQQQQQQNYFQNQQQHHRSEHITPPIQISTTNQSNLLSQLTSGGSSPNSRTNNNQFNFRSSNNQLSNLLQQQQQQQQQQHIQLQKKLGSTQNLNFSNINSLANTITRPQSTNPSDFPTLNRTNSTQAAAAAAAAISRALNSQQFSNVPQSAPILTSQQQANIQSLLTNSLYSASNSTNAINNNSINNNNNNNNNSSTNSMNNSSNNVLQNLTNQLQSMNPFANNQMQQQQQQQLQNQQQMQSNTSTSGKMWSSFGSALKDNNMMKYSQENQQEFQIQQEDFPALPRTLDCLTGDQQIKSQQQPQLQQQMSQTSQQTQVVLQQQPNQQQQQQQQQQQNDLSTKTSTQSQIQVKKGIQIYADGRVKNVPSNMLLDQFGIVGLLAYFKADRDKDMFTLALGTDLTALGLNLNATDSLYHSFLSPFSDLQSRLQDIDYPVPVEYIVNYQIKDKLAKIEMNRYTDDLVFYLFYMNCGDLMQLQAACILHERDWRYHVDKRVWLTKVQGLQPQQKTQEYEKGVYIVFDAHQWKRIQTEMTIEYAKLADKPNLLTYTQQQQR